MTKTTLINPILRKDALVNARSPKMIIVVTMINCLFAIIASVALPCHLDRVIRHIIHT